jgi:hypothetical protein
MYLGIKKVNPLENYKLLLVFENDETKIFDMHEYLELGLFRELKDLKTFNTVSISFDTIMWENGVDLDPEILYQNSKTI